MQKDLVFFKKEGEEGVALTSTSANHIANFGQGVYSRCGDTN